MDFNGLGCTEVKLLHIFPCWNTPLQCKFVFTSEERKFGGGCELCKVLGIKVLQLFPFSFFFLLFFFLFLDLKPCLHHVVTACIYYDKLVLFSMDFGIYLIISEYKLALCSAVYDVFFPPTTPTLFYLGVCSDKEILSCFRHEHPIIPVIKEHRTLAKLLNCTLGSICSLARLSLQTQRYSLHGYWLQTSTATGRLSMEEPNLQVEIIFDILNVSSPSFFVT